MISQKPGKSITTSVPSFAIRFHTGGEELDEIYPSAEDTDDEAEKPDDDMLSSQENAVSTHEVTGATAAVHASSSTSINNSTSLASGSASVSVTNALSRDPSPMKEYLKGLGKRSTSMDAGIIDLTSGSDTWRIFHELKGKITKTVEEKFNEKFSDKKPGPSSLSGELTRRGRLGSTGKSKDNSSISDEEVMSEPVNLLTGDSKQFLLKCESSPSKTLEDKKSLSLEEKDDVLSDSLTDPPSTSSAVDGSDLTDISSKGLMKKAGFRNRMKHNLSGLRHRHRATNPPVPGCITMSSLSASADEEVELPTDSDVEPAVEASEDTKFLTEQLADNFSIPTTDFRTNVPTSFPPIQKKKKHLDNYFVIIARLWSSKFVIIGLMMCVYSIFYSVPSSVIGFFFGGFLMYLYYAIRDLFRNLVPCNRSRMNLHFPSTSIDTPSDMPILEVPAVKEYQPLTKYEGWMNEYTDNYEPGTYSLTATQTVYVKLEGSTLRISHTRLKIPKRGMWNERKHKLRFTHQRIYNITNCEIKLLPEGLTRRRLWSKKYPICVVLLKSSKHDVSIVKEVRPLDEMDQKSGINIDSNSMELGSIGSDVAPDYCTDSKSDWDESSLLDTKSTETKSVDEEETSLPEELSDEDTFCHIDKTALEENCLYLFARTDREKEDWYRRLVAAVKFSSSEEEVSSVHSATESMTCSSIVNAEASKASTVNVVQPLELQQEEQESHVKADQNLETPIFPSDLEDENIEYIKFMSIYKLQVLTSRGVHILTLPPSCNFPAYTNHRNLNKQQKIEAEMENIMLKDVAPNLMWINAFTGRVLFDLMKNTQCILKLQERIQKKLSAIRLPHFVGEILVSDLDLGESVPLIHTASRPVLDERGIWVNIDVSYKGTASLTLETKLNLLKLKKDQIVEQSSAPLPSCIPTTSVTNADKRSSPMFDSDLDDSAESSDDDSDFDKSSTDEEYVQNSTQNTGSAGKRILRMVNKIAASKYFQHATENKYIKRAMEEVSNTRIILSLDIKGFSGTLVLNFPPPPSDRLWYGFRGCPRLVLSAHPKLGERQVNISHVVSWIEKQLIKEFQKKLVLPNMDDIVITAMKDHLPK